MATLPTPTIVRIKRRLGSESSETIIVSTKRKRPNSDGDDIDTTKDPIPEVCTAILKRLTTLKQGDSIEVEAKKALESEPKHSWELKESFKKGFTSSPKDLIHKKSKSDISAIRFKLVCSKRNLEKDESENSEFQMLDAMKAIEENTLVPVASSSSNTNADTISCNGVPMESEKVEFVYDLYYTSLPMELSSWINNICEIQKYNALDYRDESSKITEVFEDDSDENSESNWRNDYPEEEDGPYYDGDDDDDQMLCEELERKAKFDNDDTDESFDVDEFNESGDFDEVGELIIYKNSQIKRNVIFGRKGKATESSDESESDSE